MSKTIYDVGKLAFHSNSSSIDDALVQVIDIVLEEAEKAIRAAIRPEYPKASILYKECFNEGVREAAHMVGRLKQTTF